MTSLLLTALLAPAAPQTSFADVATVTAVFDPPQAKPGQMVTLKLTVTPKPGNWTYPVNPPGDQFSKNVIRFPADGDVTFRDEVTDPPDAKIKPEDPKDHYYPEPATWLLEGVVSPTASPGKRTVTLAGTKLQVCNDNNCFFTDRTQAPSATLEILPGAAGPAVPPAGPPRNGTKPPTPSAGPDTPTKKAKSEPTHQGIEKKSLQPADAYKTALSAVRESLKGDGSAANVAPPSRGGLFAFLLTAAIWGWVSLATPCVFPMIPITVSLFLKQGNQSTRKAIQLSLVYSLTIIVIIGLSAWALLRTFQWLSVNPFMNIALGALFIYFALSLFGLYDIALPGFLLRAAEKRRGAGGMVGTVFGAVAFSIVAFTCVAPFLGGFAGMASSNQYQQWELVLGGLAFATAFASPFFVLALFPSLLKKLPRSGGWLDTVKVVMGFLEVAAALVFFRTAELRLLPKTEFFTYDMVLAGWVTVSLATAAYLLGQFHLAHDEPTRRVGVGRLIFGMLFLGFGLYLAPGLLKQPDGRPQRPAGTVFAWVDAFLLPDAPPHLPWSADLPAALKQGKPVFVDFTGKTCKNCRLNEENVFPTPELDSLLRQYTLVQIYTDEVPAEFFTGSTTRSEREAEAGANYEFQTQAFGTNQLPLYVVLKPGANGSVTVVGVYDEGKINDPARFAEFLRKGLSK